MADETCDVSIRITPAVEKQSVVAEAQTRSQFLLADKKHVPERRVSGLTDENGVVVLALLRDAKIKDRDDAEPHRYTVSIPRAGYSRTVVVPDSATAELADIVETA